jgi:hypothetical protein
MLKLQRQARAMKHETGDGSTAPNRMVSDTELFSMMGFRPNVIN